MSVEIVENHILIKESVQRKESDTISVERTIILVVFVDFKSVTQIQIQEPANIETSSSEDENTFHINRLKVSIIKQPTTENKGQNMRHRNRNAGRNRYSHKYSL